MAAANWAMHTQCELKGVHGQRPNPNPASVDICSSVLSVGHSGHLLAGCFCSQEEDFLPTYEKICVPLLATKS